MRIWIDARKINRENNLWYFIKNYIENLDKSNEYLVFVPYDFNIEKNSENITFLKIKLGNSLLDEIKFWSILNKRKLDKVIFFDASIPLNYLGKYYSYPWTFEKLIYWNWISKRRSLILKYKLKKSAKIVCFTNCQKYDLNENIGISLDKIDLHKPKIKKFSAKNKASKNIDFDYILTDINSEIEILQKLYKAIKEFDNLKIIIWWNNKYLKNKIQTLLDEKNIIFEDYSEELLKNAKIFFYWENTNIFPFDLAKAIQYNLKIIAPKNRNTKEIIWDKAEYYSSISKSSIENAIKNKLN